MDACFEIFVPGVVGIAGLSRAREPFIWEGKEYLQQPVQYSWGAHVLLTETAVSSLVANRLSGRLDTGDLTGLLVQDNALDLFRLEVNGCDVDWSGSSTLEALIRGQLSAQRRWAAAFLPAWERLDEVVAGDVDDLLRTLAEVLKFDAERRGFIMWHDE